MTERNRPYVVGFLGFMAIVSAVIVFMWTTTFQTEFSNVVLTGVVMLMWGLFGAWIMVGIRFEPFRFQRAIESIMWTVLSVVAIFMVNKVVPFTLALAVDPINIQLFSVLQGVGEECFFRLWLTTTIYKVTRSQILAIVVSSGTWTIYHLARYAGNLNALLTVFIAGVVLGFVVLKSRMGDGVIFAHAVVNFLATA